MEREKAIALLKEIAEKKFALKWVSLVSGKSGWEIRIKPEVPNLACLRPIVEKHSLALKEVDGLVVVFREQMEYQESQ